MSVPHALMALLARRDMHGYELRRQLEEELGPDWRLDFGQLYRALASMSQRRWVTVRREKSDSGGPPRKVYRITAPGRAALQRWLAQPLPAPERARDGLGVKLRFGEGLIASGSDDVLLDLLGQQLAHAHPQARFSCNRVGSLGGLLALRDQRAHLAGIHLLDADSGQYNVPFVKHLLPEEPVLLVNLSVREQGLMLAPGNPRGIGGVRDLVRGGIRLVNRQPGAGTRLLLHHQLRRNGIEPRSVRGYERQLPTHAAVAAAIAAGSADAGPGIRAAAVASGLDFLPLGEERYDLAIPRRLYDSPRLRPLLETIHGAAYRRAAAAITGYDLSRMSEIVADIH